MDENVYSILFLRLVAGTIFLMVKSSCRGEDILYFNAVIIDEMILNVSGYYSTRIDESVILEFRTNPTQSFLKQVLNLKVKELIIFHDEKERLYIGPFGVKEQFGILIFEKL
ncbi:hypothetical protein [Halobacillus sp. BAB-2008]|uniref:hypothetical protein n=1 Tax=Halobacillus sp. BAB-2008 TaxID=1246484 RepID=UPI0002A51340|nr:hypothetical protein [Halobacillus sp. BAB-2008]ELK47195.1 hypothetical protein D479_07077 [Halobacillus sp. BAB-2008]